MYKCFKFINFCPLLIHSKSNYNLKICIQLSERERRGGEDGDWNFLLTTQFYKMYDEF
jgi:hypothetical protein